VAGAIRPGVPRCCAQPGIGIAGGGHPVLGHLSGDLQRPSPPGSSGSGTWATSRPATSASNPAASAATPAVGPSPAAIAAALRSPGSSGSGTCATSCPTTSASNAAAPVRTFPARPVVRRPALCLPRILGRCAGPPDTSSLHPPIARVGMGSRRHSIPDRPAPIQQPRQPGHAAHRCISSPPLRTPLVRSCEDPLGTDRRTPITRSLSQRLRDKSRAKRQVKFASESPGVGPPPRTPRKAEL
jgi:hypothetical protein